MKIEKRDSVINFEKNLLIIWFMIENVCQLYSHQEREIGIEFQFEIPLKTTFYIVLLELKMIACMTHPPFLSIFSGKLYIKKSL